MYNCSRVFAKKKSKVLINDGKQGREGGSDYFNKQTETERNAGNCFGVCTYINVNWISSAVLPKSTSYLDTTIISSTLFVDPSIRSHRFSLTTWKLNTEIIWYAYLDG